MWEALLVSTGGLFAPIFVLVISLILSTEHGREKAATFLAGLAFGYVAVGVVTLMAGAALPTGGAGRNGHIVRAALGALFLVLGARDWRRGPRESQGLDSALSLRGPKVFGIGFLVSLLNFKNLAIFITAVSALIGLPLAERVAGVAGVTAVFCLPVYAPILLAIVLGERATEPLRRLRVWIERHQHTMLLLVYFVFGSLFLVQGVRGLMA